MLALIGRELVRRGSSVWLITVGSSGEVRLGAAADWHYQSGDAEPSSWQVQLTRYGPGKSETATVSADSVLHFRWSTTAGRPYEGISPMGWASDSARGHSAAETSLANEAGGPVAQLLALPVDPGDGLAADDDNAGINPVVERLKSDLAAAKGRAAFVETTAAGWGEGKGAAPMQDWKPHRLGPAFPPEMVQFANDSYYRTLSACGCPPALADPRADGTSQREGLRRWHLQTVLPIAGMIESELSMKLDSTVRLAFDSYPLDMQSRSTTVAKLVSAGVDVGVAMNAVGLSDA